MCVILVTVSAYLQMETVDESVSGRGGYVALRRDVTATSNGRVSQSNRSSDQQQRRSRLQAASATPRSEDLHAVGVLDLSRDDSLRLNLLLNVNGDQSTRVEKETTC